MIFGASPLSASPQANSSWFFCRLSSLSRAAYLPLPLPSLRRTVWAFGSCLPTLPAADFCRPVRRNRSLLSPDSGTNGRSPEVSSTAFRTQPADLQPVPLMDMGFAVTCPLARHRMPLIRFLYLGSPVCATLLPDPASRRRPCASLSLHLHQVVKGTFTPKLSNMLGTHEKPRLREQPGFSSVSLREIILPNLTFPAPAGGDDAQSQKPPAAMRMTRSQTSACVQISTFLSGCLQAKRDPTVY
jgi:hypothetical protein